MKVLSEKLRGGVGLRHIVLTVNVLTHEHPLWQHAVRGVQFHLVGFIHLDVSTITVIQCGGWVRTPHHRPRGLLTRTCPLKHSSCVWDSSVKTSPKLSVPVSNPHLNEIYSLIYNLVGFETQKHARVISWMIAVSEHERDFKLFTVTICIKLIPHLQSIFTFKYICLRNRVWYLHSCYL